MKNNLTNLPFLELPNLFIRAAIFVSAFVSCENKIVSSETVIEGEIKEHLTHSDSIFFSPGFIEEKFYKVPVLGAEVEDQKFTINGHFPYPHMYHVNLKSERNKIPFRGGIYFIDEESGIVEIDSLGAGECSTISGSTFEEYKDQFLPFFFPEYDCKTANILWFINQNPSEFDAELLNYVRKHSNSFVGLWFLIRRINSEGHKGIFEEILNSFSEETKKEELWQLASDDIEDIRIKEGYLFPPLELKNISLNNEKLKIPDSKYILIDYWFSTCKPCLKNFPKLKELYKRYNSSGFEIVGISVDKSERIQDWKKVVEGRELSWIHYLDEDGIEASKDKISFFPTTFLLNDKGEVIRKNITPEELEDFLGKNLSLD